MKRHMAKCVPAGNFAHRILESSLFQNFMALLIILNVVILMVQAEMINSTVSSMQKIKLVLDGIDWGILSVFILELILRWVEDFWQFWKRTWDVFDFTVTILSVLPEIIGAFTEKQTSGFLVILRQFRILRTLKIIIRFRPLRLTVLIIFRSLKGASATLLLLVVLGYFFALVGIALFKGYAHSEVKNLTYKESFKNLSNALATLFILFTGDNWHALLKDTWKVPELQNTSINIFIIGWVIVAGFMLKMVFMADVVSSFEHARKELTKEVQQIKMQIEEQSVKKERTSSCERGGKAWDTCVMEKMWEINDQEVQRMVWPRQSLITYLELMETLQERLEERKQMQNLEVQAFLNQHTS
ncbi:cation channel sperm-associated protein 2-like [Salminus brasiliensis]|uniref:cation channel sperm-associated protein 2-like n=1 Tax=Salminus brasiliensis TaxID=930266 RepID=UPI003B8328EF